MRLQKLLLALLASSMFFSSCNIFTGEIRDDAQELNNLMTSYDLWYVDINQTEGTDNIPFISKAFTLSFSSGLLYANNNIAEVGVTGNGYGIIAGNYNTARGVLQMIHSIDGIYDFDVEVVSFNELRIYDRFNDVSYLLVGYQRDNFDYDKLFYDNIEFFLQEYEAWERSAVSGGTANPFDKEHFLQFTYENNNTFYSSEDPFGTDVANINWDYVGDYEVFNVQGTNKLKILELRYDGGAVEEFELTVLDDQNIRLFHNASGTQYDFTGLGFIQILRNNKKTGVRNNNRVRTKVIRKEKIRKH